MISESEKSDLLEDTSNHFALLCHGDFSPFYLLLFTYILEHKPQVEFYQLDKDGSETDAEEQHLLLWP